MTLILASSLLNISSGEVPKLAMEAPTSLAGNITPNPNFLSSGACRGSPGKYTCVNPCVTPQLAFPVFSRDPRCTVYLIRSINNARAMEKLWPMVLPTNWEKLTILQQMLVATDLERIARGYPPYLGLNANLDATAAAAASRAADPPVDRQFAAGYDALGALGYGATWSEGYNVLVADYGMIYADGWGGSHFTWNVACTSAASHACWAHRNEILGSAPHFNPGVGLWCDTCEMGAGFSIVHGRPSYTQLIEMPLASPPHMVFTWQSELRYFPSGAIGPVKGLVVTPIYFQDTTLRIQWTVSGAPNVSLAVLYTFPGTTCGRLASVVTFRYVAAFNIRRNTLTLTGLSYFNPQDEYSAVIRVFTPSGSLTSRCVSLHRD